MHGQLHHIELYVSDLSQSRIFWSWLLETLDYQLYQDFTGGFSYKRGLSYLVFVQVEDKYRDKPYHRCGVGLNHLAFIADSKAFIDRITIELEDKGIPVLYKDKHPYAGGEGYYAVYFEDPDRIKVEIALYQEHGDD